jgi:hypothetical protein
LIWSTAVTLFSIAGVSFTPDGDVPPTISPDASRDLVARASAEFTFWPRETPEADGVGATALSALTHAAPAIAQADAAATQPIAEPRHHQFFQQGSWRWQPTFALASDFNDVSLAMGGVAFSYFIERDLTIDFELNTLYINQQGDASNTGAVAMALLFRWHFMIDENSPRSPRWSLYADMGGGLLYAGTDVPLDGSHFNFTPQAGIGASFLISEASDARLMTGVRWYHISNANVFDANDGVDSPMLYAGLNLPF